MEADMLRICGIAVLCSILGALLGGLSGEAHTAVRLGGLALVLGGALALLGEITGQVRAIGEDSASEYVSLMLRGLGIVTLGRICSDICKDCGQTSMASAVDTCASLAVVAIALPAVYDLLGAVDSLLGQV